jgi:hypothetical protein
MKAYLVTSGGVFALVLLAHLARVVAEGPGVARNPWFVASTVAAVAMCVWAIRLLRLLPRA